MIAVILGKSNSGKTTLFKEAFTDPYKKLVTMTTRPKRPNEIEGQDYYFVSDESFDYLKSCGRIIAPRIFINADGDAWQYGIPAHLIELEEKQIIILDPAGYKELVKSLENYPKKIISIFIECPDHIRIDRAVKRGDNENEIIRRIDSDQSDFAGIIERADHIIQNYYHDDPDIPVEQLESILKSLF